MCVRPFAWGGMVLIAVVALVGMSTARLARRDHRPATVFVDPRFHNGNTFVIRSEPGSAITSAATSKKSRPPRGPDAEAVLVTWDLTGDYSFTENEAWESALESARSQVTHDLKLVAPLSRETIREKLVKNWEPEKNPKILEGTEAVRIKLHMELNRGTYRELAEADRAVRVEERTEGVGRILGIVVVALGAVAGYIRLDDLTKGYYTGRLRALTVAVVAAATYAITRV